VFCKRSGFTTLPSLSLTPAFSPVHIADSGSSRFNGFSRGVAEASR